MSEDDDFKKFVTWTGSHRDIFFEINTFTGYDGKRRWTFYLHIFIDQLPESVRERFWLEPVTDEMAVYKNRVIYTYYKEPLIATLDWHGGCSYYRKIHGFDGERRAVKIGCDYNHLGDEGMTYTFESVVYDVANCIDSLHILIPNIKRWCRICGEFFVPEADQTRCSNCKKEYNK